MARTKPRIETDKAITISTDDLYTLLFSSVRYALGRSTYIVSTVVDIVLRYQDRLTPDMRGTIIRDVSERLAEDRARGVTTGMAMDQAEWERLVAELLKTP